MLLAQNIRNLNFFTAIYQKINYQHYFQTELLNFFYRVFLSEGVRDIPHWPKSFLPSSIWFPHKMILQLNNLIFRYLNGIWGMETPLRSQKLLKNIEIFTTYLGHRHEVKKYFPIIPQVCKSQIRISEVLIIGNGTSWHQQLILDQINISKIGCYLIEQC